MFRTFRLGWCNWFKITCHSWICCCSTGKKISPISNSASWTWLLNCKHHQHHQRSDWHGAMDKMSCNDFRTERVFRRNDSCPCTFLDSSRRRFHDFWFVGVHGFWNGFNKYSLLIGRGHHVVTNSSCYFSNAFCFFWVKNANNIFATCLWLFVVMAITHDCNTHHAQRFVEVWVSGN